MTLRHPPPTSRAAAANEGPGKPGPSAFLGSGNSGPLFTSRAGCATSLACVHLAHAATAAFCRSELWPIGSHSTRACAPRITRGVIRAESPLLACARSCAARCPSSGSPTRCNHPCGAVAPDLIHLRSEGEASRAAVHSAAAADPPVSAALSRPCDLRDERRRGGDSGRISLGISLAGRGVVERQEPLPRSSAEGDRRNDSWACIQDRQVIRPESPTAASARDRALTFRSTHGKARALAVGRQVIRAESPLLKIPIQGVCHDLAAA